MSIVDPTLHVLTVPDVDAWRDANVQRLRDQAPVCEHPDPKRSGLISNWISAIRCAAKSEHQWVVVISDDAIPLQGWKENLERAVTHSPAPVLGLTYFGDIPRLCAKRSYLLGEGLLFGGGIAYRVELLQGLAEFAETYQASGGTEDDVCAAAYLRDIGEKSASVVRAIFGQPTLAQAPSLIGNRCQIRRPSRTIENGTPRWGLGSISYDRSLERSI